MANFNKVFLMGNLTRDPQLSYLPSETAVVEFGLAVNRRWTGKDGTKKEETCFVDCRAFGRQAENINKYLSKGRALFVEGRLSFDSWTAQDGTKRSKHRVTVENFQFLGSAPGASDKSDISDGAVSYDKSNTQAATDKVTDDIPF
ncbi:MAG: single-stranded DNA-binding protein [Planctomycetota bacterium]|jgi:single-strand DNA-binding protein